MEMAGSPRGSCDRDVGEEFGKAWFDSTTSQSSRPIVAHATGPMGGSGDPVLDRPPEGSGENRVAGRDFS